MKERLTDLHCSASSAEPELPLHVHSRPIYIVSEEGRERFDEIIAFIGKDVNFPLRQTSLRGCF